MPTNLMMAYETLEIEDQKLVEQLIYSLVMKVKNQSQVEHDSEKQKTLLTELESLKGTLSSCKYSSIEAARDDRLSDKVWGITVTVFLDSNIILDFLVPNTDYADEAFSVLKLSVTKNIDYYISAASLTDIFYILNKTLKDIEKSKSLIRNILKFVSIAGVDDTCIINALNSTWPDFEDSVQHEVASQIRADYIVTRNIKDYSNSTIVVVTPAEFISRV